MLQCGNPLAAVALAYGEKVLVVQRQQAIKGVEKVVLVAKTHLMH